MPTYMSDSLSDKYWIECQNMCQIQRQQICETNIQMACQPYEICKIEKTELYHFGDHTNFK